MTGAKSSECVLQILVQNARQVLISIYLGPAITNVVSRLIVKATLGMN